MKIKILSIIVLLTNLLTAQNADKKKDMRLLVESGYETTAGNKYAHFGAGIEYKISKRNSISFRLKYHHADINHEEKGSSSSVMILNPGYKIVYKSEVISIPINYKFTSAFFINNVEIFFNAGPTLNFTWDDEYIVAKNIKKINNKAYLNINLGTGFSYKLNEKNKVYVSGEAFIIGGAKAKGEGLLTVGLPPSSSMINLGWEYNL